MRLRNSPVQTLDLIRNCSAKLKVGFLAFVMLADIVLLSTGCSSIKYGRFIKSMNTGDSTFVKSEIENGINVKFDVGNNMSPLMYAAAYGRSEMVKMLLRKGARVNAKDQFDQTPLMHAAVAPNNNFFINKRCLECCRESFVVEKTQIIRMLIEMGAKVNATDVYERSVLMHYAMGGNPSVTLVEFLVAKGADINAKRNTGQTVLMYFANPSTANSGFYDNLAFQKKMKPNTESLSFLLDAGARCNNYDIGGNTALMYAANSKFDDNVIALLNSGADVNVTNNDGITALMLARSAKTVRILHHAGADLRAKDNFGNGVFDHIMSSTALATSERAEIGPLLIDNEARDSKGLATIVVSKNLIVEKLDNKKPTTDYWEGKQLYLQVPSGSHVLKVSLKFPYRFFKGKKYYAPSIIHSIVLRSGGLYVLTCSIDSDEKKYRIWYETYSQL